MKKFFVLTGVLLCTLLLAAQVQLDYRNGYVVLANKDTLYGEIGQLPIKSKITKVHFREKGASVDKVYSAYDLLSFNFWPDVTYESIELPTYRQKDTIYTWHFVLRRLSGAINLLILNSSSGEDRFFVKNQKYGLNELKNPIETINNQVFRDNRYMAVIAKYTNDVLGFQSRIASYGYDEENLVALISEYNVHFGENKGYKPYFDWDPSLYVSTGSIVDLFDKGIRGFHIDLEYALSNPHNLMRSEFVIGMNYKRLNYTSGYTRDSLVEMLSLSSPNYTKTYHNPTRANMQYVLSTNIIGVPIFWRLNNRPSLISPVLEFGFEPFLVQENFKIQGQPTIRTKLSVGLGAKCGLGVGLNYQRFRLRYLYYVDEIPGSTLTLQYQLY